MVILTAVIETPRAPTDRIHIANLTIEVIAEITALGPIADAASGNLHRGTTAPRHIEVVQFKDPSLEATRTNLVDRSVERDRVAVDFDDLIQYFFDSHIFQIKG